jgi:CRP-like cAMP-binding protein
MDAIIGGLIKTKLFNGFTQNEAEAIAPLLGCQQKSYPKGAVLIETDMPVDFVGVVLSGKLTTYKEDIDGRLNLIRKTGAYEMFGVDIASTPTQVSPLMILCATDADVLTFPYSLIASPGPILDRFRCVMLKNILELTANQNMRQLYKIDILSRKGLRDRIMLYLTLQAKRKKTNDLVLSFNREELAAYLCVDRSALSRELGRMQKEGLIEFDRNHFRLLSGIGG